MGDDDRFDPRDLPSGRERQACSAEHNGVANAILGVAITGAGTFLAPGKIKIVALAALIAALVNLANAYNNLLNCLEAAKQGKDAASVKAEQERLNREIEKLKKTVPAN